MGNEDGFKSAVAAVRTNKIVNIDKSTFFSFAYGNEIAFVYKDNYYILNCGEELWEEVNNKVKELKTVQKLKGWWYEQSKTGDVSDWSNNFNNLKR